jgi:hypothetical protein
LVDGVSLKRILVARNRVKHLPGNLWRTSHPKGPEKPILDSVWKHQLNIILVRFIYDRFLTKSTLLLGFFLCQDVVLKCALAFYLTRSGHLKTFLRS